jgi:hypothetical protein
MMKYLFDEVARSIIFAVEFGSEETTMKIISSTIILAAMLLTTPLAMAGEKDCLLKGTVQRSDKTGQEVTTVKIHSVKKYADESNCRVRRGEKLEFKLPGADRLDSAPDGSEVKYRYRSDDDGNADTQLISIGA